MILLISHQFCSTYFRKTLRRTFQVGILLLLTIYKSTFVPIPAFQHRRVELGRPYCLDLILSIAFVVHLFLFLDSSPLWCHFTPLPVLF
jgi:hypothetical protein